MTHQKLTPQEEEKARIVQEAIVGTITNSQAAKQLDLSVRQLQRAKARYRKEGAVGIVHKLKGRVSNHHIDQSVKAEAIQVIQKQYEDFKPTFATEKLEENHAISVSPETTRLWMIEAGLWKSRKQKQSPYRSWRPRKEYFGELEQFDGSYHLWFEQRFLDESGCPIEVCLLAAIDDATGIITKAMFTANEGVVAVFTFWEEYCLEHGKPLGIYLDQFSTYKINHKNATDNHDLMTQFQQVTQTLHMPLITAHSAEAKGRVERLFLTLQDRLVKEMRLAGINTPEQGNKFLKEVFLSSFNSKFSVVPAKDGNVHRSLLAQERDGIHHIFSQKETRRINQDFTIQFHATWYQLEEIQLTTVRPLETVLVETWLNGTIHILLRGKELSYFTLPEKPKKHVKQPVILTTHRLQFNPSPDHPWRKKFLP